MSQTHKLKITGEELDKRLDQIPLINETNERIDGLEERVETLEEQGPAGTSDVGTIFNHFPTEEEILALPNNSYFTIRARGEVYDEVNGSLDPFCENATYYITTSWASQRNAMRYKNAKNQEVFVVPVNQSPGEMFMPYYNIRQGIEFAEHNSKILEKLFGYGTTQYGAVLKFPSGHFYFNKPIDLTIGADRSFSIVGTARAAYGTDILTGTTFLHFIDLQPDETGKAIAIKTSQCTLQDFTIVGNQYKYHINRNDTIDYKDNYDIQIEETIPTTSSGQQIKTTGIEITAGSIIKDVTFKNFYYGLNTPIQNGAYSNITCNNCHYGVTMYGDSKIFNLTVWDVVVGLCIRGALVSATGIRGDSVGKHLVQIVTNGGQHILTDLDCDFGMESIVAIGEEGANCEVKNLNINGIHGRAGAAHLYDARIENSEITAEDIIPGKEHEYGVISIYPNCSLNGGILTINQRHENNSPFDIDEMKHFKVPYILLSAAQGTKATDLQFFISAYNSKEFSNNKKEWLQQRIKINSTDSCNILIHTSDGYLKYTNGTAGTFIEEDVEDIYKRMDKSSLVLKTEAVLTVNGFYPDENGNVKIVDEIPEPWADDIEKLPIAGENPNKRYVIDNYIWAQRIKEIIPEQIVPNFTNWLYKGLTPSMKGQDKTLLDGCGYRRHAITQYDYEVGGLGNYIIKNISDTSEEWYYNYITTGLIPITNKDSNGNPSIIRINQIGYNYDNMGIAFIRFYNNERYTDKFICGGNNNNFNDVLSENSGAKYEKINTGINTILKNIEIPINEITTQALLYDNSNDKIEGTGIEYFSVFFSTKVPLDEIIITVNEEWENNYIVQPEQKIWEWYNTGELLVKPEYATKEELNELEERVETLEENKIITFSKSFIDLIGGGQAQLKYRIWSNDFTEIWIRKAPYEFGDTNVRFTLPVELVEDWENNKVNNYIATAFPSGSEGQVLINNLSVTGDELSITFDSIGNNLPNHIEFSIYVTGYKK